MCKGICTQMCLIALFITTKIETMLISALIILVAKGKLRWKENIMWMLGLPLPIP